MQKDPAVDQEDIEQDMEVDLLVGRLKKKTRSVALRRRIDVARRREVHTRAMERLPQDGNAREDPSIIAERQDLLLAIKRSASTWPRGDELVECVRRGYTARQTAIILGVSKSSANDLLASFKTQTRNLYGEEAL